MLETLIGKNVEGNGSGSVSMLSQNFTGELKKFTRKTQVGH
jgi:hypothetical protein